ncbi:30S ribosomal protein S2 [Candidatus Nanosalina sp. VS9-1]|uniref:30S ribosomal protein S2 n=1 Tax=Candidatus Nanosalina sp. VS9-1 TaxID=3388566 RepID=UPI0039E010B8
MGDEEELLVEREEYLKNGVHIGTRSQHVDMDDYIFHVKKNGLAILDLNKTDEQIRKVAEILADYSPEEILVVGRKEEVYQPIKTLSEVLGTDSVNGRFMPGTLTNPRSDNFKEPEIVLVTDPEEDGQAITEASDVDIPVVAIADSENSLDDVDYVIPANNKGENAVGMVFWLLAQQIKEANGEKLDAKLEDFVSSYSEEEDGEAAEA